MFFSFKMLQRSFDLGRQLGSGITAHPDGLGRALRGASPAAAAEFTPELGHPLFTQLNGAEGADFYAAQALTAIFGGEHGRDFAPLDIYLEQEGCRP